MSSIQLCLDNFLTMNNFVSVKDLIYREEDKSIYISRKPGRRSSVIDISEDCGIEEIILHLMRTNMIY